MATIHKIESVFPEIPAAAQMQLVVVLPKGKNVIIPTYTNDTVSSLKWSIQQKSGIPMAEQKLFLGETELIGDDRKHNPEVGTEMFVPGCKSLAEHGIGDSTTLTLRRRVLLDV